ncbi:MAG TPA: phosphotransferase [Chloroflexaceae bacterium]|nr:phosphotransferase [Chloroflexaceae bacterium]
MAPHSLFPSVEAMLTPEALAALGGAPVAEARCTPLTPEFAKSGSRLVLVEADPPDGPRFVLKRVDPARDWLMRATDDGRCRSVALWQHGLLDRLPPPLAHMVLACAGDGAGSAILMRDVGPAMLTNRPYTPAANSLTLAAMAAMHAAFLDDPALAAPEAGLCTLERYFTMFAPATAWRELPAGDELPPLILEGWERVSDLLDPGLARAVLALADDPTPLCAALRRAPQTLVHGDWRHANQGLAYGEDGAATVILLDWQLAAIGPPAVELGRYLGANSALLPGSKEQSLDKYRALLAARLGPRLEDAWWRPQLALGLLGGFVQDAWAIALKATTWRVGADARDHWRADLAWWSERAREGLVYL